jgi:hypothetical protein
VKYIVISVSGRMDIDSPLRLGKTTSIRFISFPFGKLTSCGESYDGAMGAAIVKTT